MRVQHHRLNRRHRFGRIGCELGHRALAKRRQDPLAPGEIVDLTITAPVKVGITGSQMRFSHANGVVQPTSVKKLTEGTDAKKK